MIVTRKQMIYGGPLSRKQRFVYRSYLNGHEVGSGQTRQESEKVAIESLLGALQKQLSPCYATRAHDGVILTTREYQPGNVICCINDLTGVRVSSIGECSIHGKAVSVGEYHADYLLKYNESL